MSEKRDVTALLLDTCRRVNETGPPLCSCPAGTCAEGKMTTAHALAARIAEGWSPPQTQTEGAR